MSGTASGGGPVDIETDVVVLGSGGAGLTASILARDTGADVILLERSERIGGTTAVSGGGAWIPLNPQMAELGIADSREDALAYCKHLTAGRAPLDLLEVFVDTGHQMIRYLEQRTPLKFGTWPIPDYHPEAPGARKGGRSLEPGLFDRNELGEWADQVRAAPIYLLPLTLKELLFVYRAHVRPDRIPADLVLKRVKDGTVACGNALVAGLLKACLDRAVSIHLRTRAVSLLREGERVTGVRALSDGRDVLVRARRAVVLACGGFEWNDRLKSQFLPGPITHPNTPPDNEGDGLIMAAEIGADLGNMSEVWGSPAAIIPGEEYEGRQLSRLVVAERMCPHTILVNRRGHRFVNEAAPYNDINKAFHHIDPNTGTYQNLPCWAVFDRQYREKYPVLTVLPGDPDPAWLFREDSLDALADSVGIDPAGLQASVSRWNGLVLERSDPDFGRHRSIVDPEAPHPSMGTIEAPPFYALPVHPGTLGTKGGPRTNARGQVLSVRGEVIPGLYAAGNVMAVPAGPGYYGGGVTIGMAMTWGYICGITAAREAPAVEAEARGFATPSRP
jgi:succinate dehydrogenase/fumarate reductase flavoprotein subunit